MDFRLTEEQIMIRDSAEAFLSEQDDDFDPLALLGGA